MTPRSLAMSDRKTSKEIQAEIDALTLQLEGALRFEIDELHKQIDEGEARYQALLKKMVGRRIRITLEGDPLYGKEAVITGPRGESKKPMYWWFRVVSTGEKQYKARTSFELLKQDDAK